MAAISEEIEVEVEPWLHSSEYDQVSYGVQAARCLFHTGIMMM